MTGEATSSRQRDKWALRRRVRAARRDRLLSRDVEAEAEALADVVTALVNDKKDGRVCRVAAYESRPTEPPTHRLVEALLAGGHEVVLPVTRPDLDLDWRHPEDSGDSGDEHLLGLDAVATAEVVVVPGLAGDLSGHRLGQGGGSYDRALARRDPSALVVLLLHDDELLGPGEIPVDAHDVTVDLVVTPGRGAVSLSPAG